VRIGGIYEWLVVYLAVLGEKEAQQGPSCSLLFFGSEEMVGSDVLYALQTRLYNLSDFPRSYYLGIIVVLQC